MLVASAHLMAPEMDFTCHSSPHGLGPEDVVRPSGSGPRPMVPAAGVESQTRDLFSLELARMLARVKGIQLIGSAKWHG